MVEGRVNMASNVIIEDTCRPMDGNIQWMRCILKAGFQMGYNANCEPEEELMWDILNVRLGK